VLGTADNACIAVNAKGLSSIRFAGDMTCILFSDAACNPHAVSTTISRSVPDLSIIGWNDAAHGIMCHRRDSAVRSSGLAVRETLTLNARNATTTDISTTIELGSCVDLCMDANYEDCMPNICKSSTQIQALLETCGIDTGFFRHE
jgi:hypothetical protein